MPQKTLIDKVTTWVGSSFSLFLHTLLFVGAFALAVAGEVSWDSMLLIVTTIVSLEAIYLAIFIQMTVNRQATQLADVSEDVEDIQEDIEEISQDVDAIQGDIEEISEETEEEQHKEQQTVAIEQLTQDVRRLLADLEQLKKGQ